MTHNLKNELPEVGKFVMLYYKYECGGEIYTDWVRAKLKIKNGIELVWYNFHDNEIQFRENGYAPYEWIGD